MNNRLTARNIDDEIAKYLSSIKSIAVPYSGLKGIDLLTYVKRHRVKAGPYKLSDLMCRFEDQVGGK